MEDFWDADDADESFDYIDKLVEEHNAKKQATQRVAQAPSPIPGPNVQPNGAPQQAQPPNGQGPAAAPLPARHPQAQAPPAAAARPQPGAFPPQQQQQQPQPLVGAISLAAAQLRAQGGLGAPAHQPPTDPVQLQQRVGELEGTNKILRNNVEALERERAALRQRVAALESRSGGPAQAASVAEMQRTMEQLKQQLMFKEQELEDAKRRAAAAPRPALPPPQQQAQQQGEGAEAGEAEQPRAKRRANGTAAPVAAPQQQAQQRQIRPLFPDVAALAADDASSAAPAAVISRLWAACPAEMGCLLRGSGAAEAEGPELTRLRGQWAADLPRAASGLLPPAALLPTLAAYVARACEAASSGSPTAPAAAAAQHSLEVAGAALTAMQHLVNEDPACRRLASCGAATAEAAGGSAAPSARVKFKNPAAVLSASPHVYASDATLQPLQAQLSRLSVSVGPSEGSNPPTAGAPGLLGLCIAAARTARGVPASLRAGATGLALALAVAAPLGRPRAALLPLLTSGAALEFMRAPAPARGPAVLLLIALLQDPAVAAAMDAAAAAAAQPGGSGDNAGNGDRNAEGQGQAQGNDTPRTRAAAAAAAAAAAGGRGGGEQGSGIKGPKNWAEDLIEAILGCLRLVPSDGEDETALARVTLSTLAVLLERKCASCFKLAMPGDEGQPKRPSSAGPTSAPKASGNGPLGGSGSGSGGTSAEAGATPSEPQGRAAGSLPVLLVLLAEEAVKYRGGGDEAVAVLRPSAWEPGRSPAARAAQLAWQRRLRLAQEALTLLRALVADSVLASAALEELVGGAPAEVQRVMAAVARISRLQPPAENMAAEMLLGALPVAPWAFAIGSSSGAASLAPPAAADRRAGLPVASAEDVAYIARGIKHRILHRMRS